MLRMTTLFFLLFSCSVGAQEVKRLETNLKDLYVFSNNEPDTDNFLYVALTFNSHQGRLPADDVLVAEYRYTIYIAESEVSNVIRTVDVYFGGPQQFAVRLDESADLIIGKFGEFVQEDGFRLYTGLKGDPAFYDQGGVRDFFDRACTPAIGFRCTDNGTVENTFANKNVAVIVVEFLVDELVGEESKTDAKFLVWAKAFKRAS